MNPVDKVVVIRCDTCTYRLTYPAFFLASTKATLRKIFRLMYRHNWQNREVIQFFEQEFANFAAHVDAIGKERAAKLNGKLQERTADYERDFLNPDPKTFPTGLSKDQIRAERQSRREWNAVRMQRVRNAKTNYERAKNDARSDTERAKQVYELFLTEKLKYRKENPSCI